MSDAAGYENRDEVHRLEVAAPLPRISANNDYEEIPSSPKYVRCCELNITLHYTR